jgi:hypothetical protein
MQHHKKGLKYYRKLINTQHKSKIQDQKIQDKKMEERRSGLSTGSPDRSGVHRTSYVESPTNRLLATWLSVLVQWCTGPRFND